MAKTKILVVEDETITAKDMQKMLNDLGYDVSAIAASGEEAIKNAEENTPDLILMDIILKGMDGIEAAGKIHDHFDIPIIYFTAFMDEERLERTKNTEPFGYIIKPYVEEELRPTIEMALQRDGLEKALRAAHRKIRATFDSIPDNMSMVDRDYNLTDVNETLIKVFGLPDRDSVLGRKCFEVLKGRKDICPNCAVAEVYKTKAPAYRTSTAEDEVATGGRNFELFAYPVLDEHKNLVGAVEFARDITEHKKSEEELKTHREHIKLINKILRHDIINNLSVINSALRLYERTKDEELLEEASAYVNKSVELINRMRELEIFISSHRGLKLYSVTEVVNKVIESYPAITFNIEGECQVLADESLSSVIDNLIRNAVVHGKTDRIDIKIGDRDEYCEIRIADYGIGIADEIKEQIFEESFLYGETGSRGLGLYIVKKVMETYDGHVHVEDNRPRGAVFVLALKRMR